MGEMQMLSAEQEQIEAARASVYTTRRPTVEALEELLFKPVPILDHGFIRVVDYMGDDAAIVQAARVSYGKGTKKLNEDRALIRYLMKHQHTTPFEMCEIKLHVKLPIFVARQWIRHRMASINEYSARYSILDKEFYIPAAENLATQSRTNRQGRGNVVDAEEARKVIELLTTDATRSYTNYVWMLNEDEQGAAVDEDRLGIARELARINLTLNTYTQWYWKIDLHNLMNFLKLRADQHAQYEIRVYADAILQLMKRWVPEAYAAFEEYRLGAVSFSKTELEVLRELVKGKAIAASSFGLTPREIAALRTTLQLD